MTFAKCISPKSPSMKHKSLSIQNLKSGEDLLLQLFDALVLSTWALHGAWVRVKKAWRLGSQVIALQFSSWKGYSKERQMTEHHYTQSSLRLPWVSTVVVVTKSHAGYCKFSRPLHCPGPIKAQELIGAAFNAISVDEL